MSINNVKQLLSGKFVRNASWLGGAELINRIFRLGTTVTLARLFSTHDYGLVAIIYTVFDFASVFTLRGGIGAKIIQADEEDVTIICNTSYWLNWILCGAIFLLQCIAAFPIANFYKDDQLILPLCTVALVYLMFPFFIVNSSLIERANQLKITAICNATQSLISNTVTVVLAFLGMGVWAIVWAIILSTPVWIIITWMHNSWRPPKSLHLTQWREVTNFGQNLLGVELLNKLRFNLDYLIVGKFLSINELGIYYFAFNAGFGITSNTIYALISALFPYLCEARKNRQELKNRYFSKLKYIGIVVISTVSLQSAFAPFYVPIIFGEKWVQGIPILINICLSVIPLTFRWTCSTLLKSIGKTQFMLKFDICYTVVFALALIISVRWGIFGVSATVLLVHLLMSIIFNIWALKSIFNKNDAYI
ncbi:lipopolysaccharide biosynthesis protein [Nostoc sp. FACHB-892]|nr:lipopolysaccharide biosynthesis protein [Nostoc sp. FACHB-892]MBD2730344.1 lipopolysaccharide biosynthesis protein [Nostoc sp. FACHB-892]